MATWWGLGVCKRSGPADLDDHGGCLTSKAISRRLTVPVCVFSHIRPKDVVRDRPNGQEDVPLVTWQMLDMLPDRRALRGGHHELEMVLAET